MTKSTELLSLVDDLTTVVIEVTCREMRAAARALAMAIRQHHPDASSIRLTDSDQGDWLYAEEWMCRATGGGSRIELDLLDDVGHLASHLYLPHLDAVPGLTVAQGRPGRGARYTLAIDESLSTTDDRPLIEVLVIRDPDGRTTVTAALAGISAASLGIHEMHVDAGAGWLWDESGPNTVTRHWRA